MVRHTSDVYIVMSLHKTCRAHFIICIGSVNLTVWLMYCTEPVCPCNGGGIPQCYVCDETNKAACERSQVLQTCPSHEVCSHVHCFNHCLFQSLNFFSNSDLCTSKRSCCMLLVKSKRDRDRTLVTVILLLWQKNAAAVDSRRRFCNNTNNH